jgi:hypothetical protein
LVIKELGIYEEAKCADSGGAPCDKQTVWLLQRRHVAIESVAFIGKESNKLEAVEEGSVLDAGDVYTEYPDPRRDEWETLILPTLRRVPIGAITAATGMSRRAVQRIRNAGTRAHRRYGEALVSFARRIIGENAH